MTEGVHQVPEPLVGAIIGGRSPDDSIRRLRVLLLDARLLRSGRTGGNHRKESEAQDGFHSSCPGVGDCRKVENDRKRKRAGPFRSGPFDSRPAEWSLSERGPRAALPPGRLAQRLARVNRDLDTTVLRAASRLIV